MAVKTQMSVGFWTSEFACSWKAQEMYCTNLLPERFGLSKPVHLVAGIFFFNDSSIKAFDSLLLEDTMSTFPLLKSQQNNTENSM